MSSTAQFSIIEIMGLLGLAQCIYLLVYMVFRSGRLSRGTLPAIYFAVLGAALLFDVAARFWSPYIEGYSSWQWAFWFMGPPLSYLLILQIAKITALPPLRSYMVLLLVPVSYAVALLLSQTEEGCAAILCFPTQEWLLITGIIASGLSLLLIWSKKDLLSGLLLQKGGKERYWLILSLIVLNVLFIATMCAFAWDVIEPETMLLFRAGLGIAIGYTASTSLLRLYPQALRVQSEEEQSLNDQELEWAFRIEKLINMDKVYQEPSYGRKELAREIGISEAVLSKIVNQYFSKSVPQLLNENRVKDACQLLKETDVPVKDISEEAGFNSLASFNRVFKDMTGTTPSAYRQKKAA